MQEDVYRGDGLNLYAYCENNPITYCDPSGYAHDKNQDSVGNASGKNKGRTASESGSTLVYIPMDADGNPIPLNKQRINGQDIPLPDPEAQGRPHTVGWKGKLRNWGSV